MEEESSFSFRLKRRKTSSFFLWMTLFQIVFSFLFLVVGNEGNLVSGSNVHYFLPPYSHSSLETDFITIGRDTSFLILHSHQKSSYSSYIDIRKYRDRELDWDAFHLQNRSQTTIIKYIHSLAILLNHRRYFEIRYPILSHSDRQIPFIPFPTLMSIIFPKRTTKMGWE